MADLQAFLSGVDAHAKRDEAYLRDVIAALNANSVTASTARFLGPGDSRSACQVEQNLIGLNGGKVACRGERCKGRGGDAASARGRATLLVAALVDALARKPAAAAHVDIGGRLGDIRLSDLPSACWPSPASCDWLDGQALARASFCSAFARGAPTQRRSKRPRQKGLRNRSFTPT